jgi:hypothetical protein
MAEASRFELDGQTDLHSALRRKRTRPSELDSCDRAPGGNLIVGLLDGGATRSTRRSGHRPASRVMTPAQSLLLIPRS